MHLVQLIVPVYDNDGQPFVAAEFTRVRRELTERFGGATAYTRAPAQGTWEDEQGRIRHDDVIVMEVMVDVLDRPWWHEYGRELARRFRQNEMAVRATSIETL
jgi:hypothetical protein